MGFRVLRVVTLWGLGFSGRFKGFVCFRSSAVINISSVESYPRRAQVDEPAKCMEDESKQEGVLNSKSFYDRGLNKYQYNFWCFLIIIIVYYTPPTPDSNQ